MNSHMIRELANIVERLQGEVNSVRFLQGKRDVDYSTEADEVEVSVVHGGKTSFFFWDLKHGDEWIETV